MLRQSGRAYTGQRAVFIRPCRSREHGPLANISLRGALDLTFASRVGGSAGSECQIRSTGERRAGVRGGGRLPPGSRPRRARE